MYSQLNIVLFWNKHFFFIQGSKGRARVPLADITQTPPASLCDRGLRRFDGVGLYDKENQQGMLCACCILLSTFDRNKIIKLYQFYYQLWILFERFLTFVLFFSTAPEPIMRGVQLGNLMNINYRASLPSLLPCTQIPETTSVGPVLPQSDTSECSQGTIKILILNNIYCDSWKFSIER